MQQHTLLSLCSASAATHGSSVFLARTLCKLTPLWALTPGIRGLQTAASIKAIYKLSPLQLWPSHLAPERISFYRLCFNCRVNIGVRQGERGGKGDVSLGRGEDEMLSWGDWRRFSSLSAWITFKGWGEGGGGCFLLMCHTQVDHIILCFFKKKKFGIIGGSWTTKSCLATDGQVWLCPHYDKWVTSSGQTENNKAKCIIHGKRPGPPNCFHLSALLVQMLPNGVKNSAQSWEAEEGGACGSQCSLFTIYKSALLPTSGAGGVSGWGVGGVVSERIHWPLEKKKLLYCLPKRWDTPSSGRVHFWHNKRDYVQVQALLVWIWDRRQGFRLFCQKQRHFNKRK